MNIPNSQNHIKHHPSISKSHKKRLTQEQVRLLESSFDAGKKLDPERKFRLARELGVPPRQIAIWYQNKRARWKNQSLELDYGSLQVKLESALTDKKELQREVDYLRGELKRAQEMVFGFRPAQTHNHAQVHVGPPVSSLSSCEEGDGSSSLNDDVDCSGNWANNNGGNQHEQHQQFAAAMQFDEDMYAACFMMGGANKGASSYGNGTVQNSGLNVNERDFWV